MLMLCNFSEADVAAQAHKMVVDIKHYGKVDWEEHYCDGCGSTVKRKYLLPAMFRCNDCAKCSLCTACFMGGASKHSARHSFTPMAAFCQVATRPIVCGVSYDAVASIAPMMVVDCKHYERIDYYKRSTTFVCDLCGKGLAITDWYRCNQCSDYDCCTACFVKKAASHNEGHRFTPMKVVVELSSLFEKLHISLSRWSTETPKIVVNPKHYDKAHLLARSCSVCGIELQLNHWYRCNQCSDYDICAECLISHATSHNNNKNHDFTPMVVFSELMRGTVIPEVPLDKVESKARIMAVKAEHCRVGREGHYYCDGCRKHLRLADWFRCHECSNYNLCTACFMIRTTTTHHCESHRFTPMAVFASGFWDFTVDLPPGSMIKSKKGVLRHVGIFVGYLREFRRYLTDEQLKALVEEEKISEECQYVINMRNTGQGISGSSGRKSKKVIDLEEVACAFQRGIEPCSFGGKRESFENTVKKAIQLYHNPGEWNEYDAVNRNCQQFATYVATKGEYCGLVLEQRKNVHEIVRNVGAGTFVAGLLLAPVTGGASLAETITGWGVGIGSDVFCVASEWLNKEKFNPY